jgi:hypothetical protein
METISTAGTDAENLEPQGTDLPQLITELVRAGYSLTFQAVPNAWGAVSDAEVVFERAPQPIPIRTVGDDLEELKQGNPPQAPIHWKFNPFKPRSLYRAVKRFHHLFVNGVSNK